MDKGGTVVTLSCPVSSRTERSISQFGNMLVCTTGQSVLRYSDYGCFCGLGGSGDPVDALDKCCQRHDNCYNALLDGTLDYCESGINIYDVVYQYSVNNCVSQGGGGPFSRSVITCHSELNSKCEQRLCECDRRAAMCMAAVPYNNQYASYDRNGQC
ncbi:phospholipase A2-like [Diadema antillarum]|uniref:phospholipase A2-like n=1 Tax=Diadema antillarum TaxID=105358 RepID=UPI003A8ACFC4